MRLSRAAIALYMGIVFVSGGVLGFYANRLYAVSSSQPRQVSKNPEEFRKGLVSFYKNRLQLNDDQVGKLELILDETNAEYQAAFRKERERSKPELNRIHDEQVSRIKALLMPQQLPEYEKILAERAKRRGQSKAVRPGGPGI